MECLARPCTAFGPGVEVMGGASLGSGAPARPAFTPKFTGNMQSKES